jgi:hypothetical protein
MTPCALFLFSKTAIMAEPWAAAGIDCYCVDEQHPKGERREGHIIRVGADVHRWVPPLVRPIIFACAFTPCTHVAVSGSRWFKGKGLYALADSIALFARSAELLEATGAPGFIENPVSTLSTYWRKPDFRFHPWQFAHIDPSAHYTKKTCLWTFNGFVMPRGLEFPLPHLGEPDDRIHKATPGDERADFRSATPPGFPQAVFDANRPDRERLAA